MIRTDPMIQRFLFPLKFYTKDVSRKKEDVGELGFTTKSLWSAKTIPKLLLLPMPTPPIWMREQAAAWLLRSLFELAVRETVK